MLVDCDFIKKKWKVKMTENFIAINGCSKLTKDKFYTVYEMEENCWIQSDNDKTSHYTKYVYLDDNTEWHACTAECGIQKAFDFSTAIEEIITQKPAVTFNKSKLPENKSKEKSNKELLGV